MKILFADAFDQTHLQAIRGMGHECDYLPATTADDLPELIHGYEGLVVRSTKVTAETIDAGDHLALIIRAGAGTNTIDVQAAAEVGIYVCNVPGQNALAVAELAFGLIAAIDRNIPDNVIDLRAGIWRKKHFSQAIGLYGRVLGIVGIGDIGLALASRAKAFGMDVYAIRKPNRDPETLRRIEELGIHLVADIHLLARQCDILSFHVPLNEATSEMIDRDLLAEMKPGAVIINTSRGEIVDEKALIEAMDEKGIRAGLDVFKDEPAAGEGTFTSALARHPNVYGTHHIGASTDQAQRAIAAGVQRILQFYSEGTVLHCVNMADPHLGATTIAVRHYDRVGVLSQVFDVLKDAQINVEQMENAVFAGANAAVATIDLRGDYTRAVHEALEAIKEVLAVTVIR